VQVFNVRFSDKIKRRSRQNGQKEFTRVPTKNNFIQNREIEKRMLETKPL